MRKWISLLLALVLLFTAGIGGLSEEEDDGDDSIQVPMDVPENGAEEGQETAETELRELTAGDEGDDVLYLQMRLKNLGYYTGEENGKYNPDTQEAVRKFQEDNRNKGLQVTGEADGKAVLKTSIGGERVLSAIAGEGLPRIC